MAVKKYGLIPFAARVLPNCCPQGNFNSEGQWPVWAMFQTGKIVHLGSALKSEGPRVKQDGIPVLMGKQQPARGFKILSSFIERVTAEGR